jgi:hypothetical protein
VCRGDRFPDAARLPLVVPAARCAHEGVLHDAHVAARAVVTVAGVIVALTRLWVGPAHAPRDAGRGAAAPLPLLGALGASGAGRLATDESCPA